MRTAAQCVDMLTWLVSSVDCELGAKCTEGLESNSAVQLSVCINNMMRSRIVALH